MIPFPFLSPSLRFAGAGRGDRVRIADASTPIPYAASYNLVTSLCAAKAFAAAGAAETFMADGVAAAVAGHIYKHVWRCKSGYAGCCAWLICLTAMEAHVEGR